MTKIHTPAPHLEFDQASVEVLRDHAYSFENMKARTPSDPANGSPQPVKCLSCGGTFTRAADGSIPCGH